MREFSVCGQDVSRETVEKLEDFERLVKHWSPKINLVSASDLGKLWTRHICDSAQLVELTDSPERWLDIGSGGGFPGIVVAILLAGTEGTTVSLVESDKRKSAFLKTAAHKLGLRVNVHDRRMEEVSIQDATTVSARAVAPLEKLLGYAHASLGSGGTALFPKGRNWKNEVEVAKEKWSFDFDVVESATDAEAAILKVCNIKRI